MFYLVFCFNLCHFSMCKNLKAWSRDFFHTSTPKVPTPLYRPRNILQLGQVWATDFSELTQHGMNAQGKHLLESGKYSLFKHKGSIQSCHYMIQCCSIKYTCNHKMQVFVTYCDKTYPPMHITRLINQPIAEVWACVSVNTCERQFGHSILAGLGPKSAIQNMNNHLLLCVLL